MAFQVVVEGAPAYSTIVGNFFPDKEANYKVRHVDVHGVKCVLTLLEVKRDAGPLSGIIDLERIYAQGYILLYSVLDRDDFTRTQNRLNDLIRSLQKVGFPIVLVAHGCELEDARVVSKQEGALFAVSKKCSYYEILSLQKSKMDRMFEDFSTQMILYHTRFLDTKRDSIIAEEKKKNDKHMSKFTEEVSHQAHLSIGNLVNHAKNKIALIKTPSTPPPEVGVSESMSTESQLYEKPIVPIEDIGNPLLFSRFAPKSSPQPSIKGGIPVKKVALRTVHSDPGIVVPPRPSRPPPLKPQITKIPIKEESSMIEKESGSQPNEKAQALLEALPGEKEINEAAELLHNSKLNNDNNQTGLENALQSLQALAESVQELDRLYSKKLAEVSKLAAKHAVSVSAALKAGIITGGVHDHKYPNEARSITEHMDALLNNVLWMIVMPEDKEARPVFLQRLHQLKESLNLVESIFKQLHQSGQTHKETPKEKVQEPIIPATSTVTSTAPSPGLVALYPFFGQAEHGQLSFNTGDVIHVITRHGNGWCTGETNGTVGYFPEAWVNQSFTEPGRNSMPQTIVDPPHLLIAKIQNAVSLGDVQEVQQYINQGFDMKADNGRLLFLAATRGHSNIVKLLILNGADSVSALAAASHSLNLPAMKVLVEEGADINSPYNGISALGSAVSTDNIAITKFLIELGAKVSCGVVMWAIENRRGEMANLLARAVQDVDTVDDKRGSTILCIAAQYNQLPVTEILIERKADVNKPNVTGNTPLFIANYFNSFEVKQALVRAGAAVPEIPLRKAPSAAFDNKEEIHDRSKEVQSNSPNSNPPNRVMQSDVNTIEAVLASLQLGQFAENFSKEMIDFEELRHLTEDDLAKLGLPMGARKKLLRALSSSSEASPAHSPSPSHLNVPHSPSSSPPKGKLFRNVQTPPRVVTKNVMRTQQLQHRHSDPGLEANRYISQSQQRFTQL